MTYENDGNEEEMKNTHEDYPPTETWWKRKDTKTTLHTLYRHATDAA